MFFLRVGLRAGLCCRCFTDERVALFFPCGLEGLCVFTRSLKIVSIDAMILGVLKMLLLTQDDSLG